MSKEKIKVLLSSPSSIRIGGVNDFTKRLLKNINGQLFSMAYIPHGRRTQEVVKYRLPFRFLADIYNFYISLNKYKPDIVHINTSLYFFTTVRNIFFILLCNKKNIPVFYYIHGWENRTYEFFLKKDIFREIFTNIFTSLKKIVVLSNEFKIKLSNMRLDKNKISLSTPIIDRNIYLNQKIVEGKLKLLFCSNIKKEKGVFLVVDSLKELSKVTDNFELNILGKGNDLALLKKIVSESNLDKNINIRGYVSASEKLNFFKESHVFLLPTVHGEGFPMVITEALASGNVIIATPSGGILDYVKEGKNGYLIKSNPPSSREIFEKIIKINNERDNMKKMSISNAALSSAFDKKVISKDIERIYMETFINN